MAVDLLLGGAVGEWALNQVRPEQVHRVFTSEDSVALVADAKGFIVETRLLNSFDGPLGDAAFSVHYPHILTAETLLRFRHAYNLHPGLLPFGRGFYPAFWSLWERTPAGATLHEMVPAVDSGPIVDQIEVPVRASDTGGTLLARVREAEKELFRRHWPAIAVGAPLPSHHPDGEGSYHSRHDFVTLRDHPDLASMSADDLLRLARALDVPGYPAWQPPLDMGHQPPRVRDGRPD